MQKNLISACILSMMGIQVYAQNSSLQPFNDNWTCNGESVTLPHDAMLQAGRTADSQSGSAGAFYKGGKYVYEKHFDNPKCKTLMFHFEGVYKNAKVYINETKAGECAYGYVPFFVDASPYLKDGDNVIKVECDNLDQPESRWYSGAGIYRPVWMFTAGSNPILPESIKIRTVSYKTPRIEVKCPRNLKVEIYDGDRKIAEGEGDAVEFDLPGAVLWSEDSPKLYTCRAYDSEESATQIFGIRQVEWSPEGLKVNGVNTLLRGGCLHHTNGLVGAATYDELEYRRVELMKKAGFNAIRSSHNPASRALIEACDRLGVYLIDESWDMWYHSKTTYDYSNNWKENYQADLKAMVQRDFNHPSVIMYSIGNELSEPASVQGMEYARKIMDLMHSLDPDRAVSAGVNLMILSSAASGKNKSSASNKSFSGLNSTLFNMITNMVGSGMNKAANSSKADKATSPFLDILDIAGYNYASGRYPKEGSLHPHRIIYGSETFPQDIAKNWKMVEKYPYLIGDFMWTAIDYMGEAGLGSWTCQEDGKGFNKPYPWLLAEAGAMDILGNPTGELFQASAVWGKLDSPVICVQVLGLKGKTPAKAVWRGTNSIPSWSWLGCEGEKATVEVYSSKARKVELSLNGKKVGKKKLKDGKAVFKVKYHPGTLTAKIYDGTGVIVEEVTLQSAGKASVHYDCPKEVHAGEVVFVPISVCDKDGIVESHDDRNLTISVSGGELLGFGSAAPRTEESYTSGSFRTLYGRAAAIIRVTGDTPPVLSIHED